MLEDFSSAYDSFELSHPDEKFINMPEQLVTPLKDQVSSITTISDELIYEKIRDQIYGNYFVVTLDGGSYFDKYDFSFEVSRTCLKLEHIRNGPLFRMPREGSSQLIQQGMSLREIYQRDGADKPIALCDDGIGTGESLERIINILDQLNLNTNKIFVLLNPRKISSIRSTDVYTIFKIKNDYEWLSQRDLIWGLPRSGLSFSSTDNMQKIYGIPYTIDNLMIEKKIAKFNDTNQFRDEILQINIDFWLKLEKVHEKKFFLDDCKRISFLSEHFNHNYRIVELLEEVKSEEYHFA